MGNHFHTHFPIITAHTGLHKQPRNLQLSLAYEPEGVGNHMRNGGRSGVSDAETSHCHNGRTFDELLADVIVGDVQNGRMQDRTTVVYLVIMIIMLIVVIIMLVIIMLIVVISMLIVMITMLSMPILRFNMAACQVRHWKCS